MPARFIKDGATQITAPITHKTNLSLYSGNVPGDIKLHELYHFTKRILKPTRATIALRQFYQLSQKIWKGLFTTRLNLIRHLKFFLRFAVRLYSTYSTDTFLTYLTDHIRLQMDEGLYTGMVMIDLQKAFDNVDHGILLHKLKALGFRDPSVSLLKSYLTNIIQKTKINGTFSDLGVIPCGLPQGSIPGPLLFLIYVNDMEAEVSCQLNLYADDSAFLVSGRDLGLI